MFILCMWDVVQIHCECGSCVCGTHIFNPVSMTTVPSRKDDLILSGYFGHACFCTSLQNWLFTLKFHNIEILLSNHGKKFNSAESDHVLVTLVFHHDTCIILNREHLNSYFFPVCKIYFTPNFHKLLLWKYLTFHRCWPNAIVSVIFCARNWVNLWLIHVLT